MRATRHGAGWTPTVVFRTGLFVCAVPVSEVLETMRPLPIQPVAGLPEFLLGISVIRGEAVPVVDLACVLGGTRGDAITRFVTVRAADRRLALTADSVIGVRRLEPSLLARVPSLLEGAASGFIDTLGAQDGAFVILLRSARLLSEEIWQALA